MDLSKHQTWRGVRNFPFYIAKKKSKRQKMDHFIYLHNSVKLRFFFFWGVAINGYRYLQIKTYQNPCTLLNIKRRGKRCSYATLTNIEFNRCQPIIEWIADPVLSFLPCFHPPHPERSGGARSCRTISQRKWSSDPPEVWSSDLLLVVSINLIIQYRRSGVFSIFDVK